MSIHSGHGCSERDRLAGSTEQGRGTRDGRRSRRLAGGIELDDEAVQGTCSIVVDLKTVPAPGGRLRIPVSDPVLDSRVVGFPIGPVVRKLQERGAPDLRDFSNFQRK